MEELKAGKGPRGRTGSGFHEATYLPAVQGVEGVGWEEKELAPESDTQGTRSKFLLQTSVGSQHARTTRRKFQEGRFLPTTRTLFQGPQLLWKDDHSHIPAVAH